MYVNITTSQTNFDFPVGYYPFHKDKHINFQPIRVNKEKNFFCYRNKTDSKDYQIIRSKYE